MERRAIAVSGTVQGVGFRPFVYNLAARHGLHGFVRNTGGEVRIEIEGEPAGLDGFLADLLAERPPLARIDDLQWESQPVHHDRAFEITSSTAERQAAIAVSQDAATCEDCLAELFDPANRRYQYPFINCTNCGPRLTIICGVPYDRCRTTMAAFPMCADCRAEYENPRDRRFHAEPIACAACGPRLMAADAQGQAIDADDALAWFIDELRAGKIGALKGLGGYHLVCDARNDDAVGALRGRKRRYEKPFAVMVKDIAAAEMLCEIPPAERDLLTSPRRPIVLLRRHASADIAASIAPQNPRIGLILPYTPLHHLLMRAMDVPLVMTSGNRSDEPICTGEPEVFERLAGIADMFLTHNRPIAVRCDDSVTRVVISAESPIRRSRGDAPQPIRLPVRCPVSMLAVGAQLKSTFALGSGSHAILSHHLGDLENFSAYRAFEKDAVLYEKLFALEPKIIAHDLHPDYASTRYAIHRAETQGLTRVPIQHHRAHVASCMAEHQLAEPVIGVAFDGSGLGDDGAIWGGEFFFGTYTCFTRAAHLRYVPLPGGETAVREPWRMALSHLRDAGANDAVLRQRIDTPAIRTLDQMLSRRINAPMTSSAGRLFDAVASLLGLRDRVSFEGQAAVELEFLAESVSATDRYACDFGMSSPQNPIALDTRPLIRAIVADLQNAIPLAIIARRFHATLSDLVVQTTLHLHRTTGIQKVVLSGGVFMNTLLLSETESRLLGRGLSVYRHRLVPPNDGGISLGQLAIAARMIGDRTCA